MSAYARLCIRRAALPALLCAGPVFVLIIGSLAL